MAKLIPRDWQRLYAHPIYWLETFVDPARFKGTCYRAANWLALGCTTGRGKNAPTKKPTRSIKEVLALALTRRFRELLSRKPCQCVACPPRPHKPFAVACLRLTRRLPFEIALLQSVNPRALRLPTQCGGRGRPGARVPQKSSMNSAIPLCADWAPCSLRPATSAICISLVAWSMTARESLAERQGSGTGPIRETAASLGGSGWGFR
jgi:hypothetical protein